MSDTQLIRSDYTLTISLYHAPVMQVSVRNWCVNWQLDYSRDFELLCLRNALQVT